MSISETIKFCNEMLVMFWQVGPLGYCSFQNILTNPIISQIDTLSYIISYYSSAITINSTTTTPKCALHSVLFQVELNIYPDIASVVVFVLTGMVVVECYLARHVLCIVNWSNQRPWSQTFFLKVFFGKEKACCEAATGGTDCTRAAIEFRPMSLFITV